MPKSKSNMYQGLIEGYELSLEIENNKQKIKMYRDLIEGYQLALELELEEDAQPKKQKISAENKALIKQLIKGIPKSTYKEYDDGELPYKLLVYADDDELEVSQFVPFKNITELDKVVDKIVAKFKDELHRIEFRWSEYYGYPNQIVIYNIQ